MTLRDRAVPKTLTQMVVKGWVTVYLAANGSEIFFQLSSGLVTTAFYS